jgi:hypothetical protein
MIRRIIYLVGLIVIVAFAWFYFINRNADKQNFEETQPLEVSSHSEAFRTTIGQMMLAYYSMTESFVNWDTSGVSQQSENFLNALNAVNMEDLKSDSLIFETAGIYLENTKKQTADLIKSPSLAEKRITLNSLTPFLYDFLRIVKYDNSKVYLIECPMAFNDEESGFWLNKTIEVRNPYLGISHPKYNKTMLKCGLAKDTLNFLSL